MTLYALLFMLLAQPAEAETAPGPMPQVTTSTVDPVGDWLVSEANLKHPDQPALQRAYRDYLAAGGTGTFMDWRRASLKGVNAPLYPTRQRWRGQIFAWDGKTYIRLPASHLELK